METVGYLVGFLVLIAFACYGCYWEIKRIENFTETEKKQKELYEELKEFLCTQEKNTIMQTTTLIELSRLFEELTAEG